jgi:hypothetical protein
MEMSKQQSTPIKQGAQAEEQKQGQKQPEAL